MEYSRSELVGVSWYNLLHWDCIRTAYCKHQTGNDINCLVIILLRINGINISILNLIFTS